MAPANLKDHHKKPRRFDEASAAFDVCFIVNVNSRGWILEKICKIIEDASGKVCYYLFSERNDKLSAPLPKARNYVFAHFALCYFTMLRHPEVLSGNCYVWYTHPDLKKGMTQSDMVDMANLCTHVFTPCSHNRDTLAEWGADPSNISVPLGGADPAQFTAKTRSGKGAIGFVGAYYPRKQPEKMLEIARLMPDQKIILLGPRPDDVENTGILWHNWDRLAEFTALPNVEYVEADYPEFGAWYQKFDVYCSTSLLEGGPIPAIEAMMGNVMPVISDTGFARDIIEHGRYPCKYCRRRCQLFVASVWHGNLAQDPG
jgi:glycosyltransferase involved in cell wall biosynthesis